MKVTILMVALVAVLMSFAGGQDNGRSAQANLDREINIPRAPGAAPVRRSPQSQTPPSYCKPCLFYAGDFDSNASDANGLANEVDVIVSTGATLYTPFIVPKGKTWKVTGLFVNTFLGGAVLYPETSPYEVRTGIPAGGGSGGKLVCHGRLPVTVKPTEGTDFGIVYGVFVRGIKGCALKGGVKYWMSVIPYCTDNSQYCSNFRGFVMNDDGAMNYRYGPLEPANDSFFNSEYFGANWEPATEQQSSKRFSVGVEGTAK
jgi:hypothetical protein